MSGSLMTIQQQLETVLGDLQKAKPLSSKHLLVIGVSTSEVAGKQIGTNSSKDVAAALYAALFSYQQKTGVALAFQCCEHLNRALVMERDEAEARGYEEVAVIPVRKAGGAMATYAFTQFRDPVIVEQIRADAGIDIGDTFIGMHLKQVAVPVRSSISAIGDAHVTMAYSRPKLIGGVRANYERTEEHESFRC
ncbi:TIGR01440 family protein [Halalkalibacterium halodurans]|uniref:UPF0340 protein AMD02_01150 n=1 Tax=Halalkalibacterium halodurans TaxID=86665 RepID=A0A0M0KGQ7_ALKHA|nr:TIGR01440 family protein [Halalkalibacterium halodurans]TPE69029.1 TIGR01440 family protein [Halalkalibacterium halodurans]